MLAISQVDLNARLLADVTYMHAKIMEIRRIYLKVRCRRGLLMNALISQWRMDYKRPPATEYKQCILPCCSDPFSFHSQTNQYSQVQAISSSTNMSTNETILVIGAGELGMEILRSLAKKTPSHSSTKITVLLKSATIDSHDPQKRKTTAELHALGISLLAGDIVTASTIELSKLFEPFHTIVGCTGFSAGRSIQVKLAHAVLDAQVARYFPWQFGVDYDVIGRGSAQDLFDEQLDVRDLLRGQSKTEWVIVSTGMFTSFLFEPWFGVVDLETDTVHALGSLENQVTLTTSEDIGNLTADILFADGPRTANEVVFVAGDTVSYGQLADIVESVLGRNIKRTEWTVKISEEELKSDPSNLIRKYRIVFAKGKGVAWDIGKTYNARKNMNVVSLKEWASKNLK